MPATERPLRAVIFDLDGVLVSTSKYHAQAWGDLVRSLGHEPPPDLEERVKGISRMASLKIALGEHAKDYNEEQLEQLATQKNEHYRRLSQNIDPNDLFPGARALFDDLRAAGIKILLGSASKNAKPVLDGLGITEYFHDIIDGFRYRHGKPHPDIFLTAARAAGADPSECIVVEDAAAGIDAAIDGGFVTVGIGTYESLKHAHLFIRSLEELTAAKLRDLQQRWRSDLWTATSPLTPRQAATHLLLGEPAKGGAWALQVTVDGQAVDLTRGKAEVSDSRLDLRTGVESAETRWTSPAHREMVLTRRGFADAACPGRRVHRYEIESVGHEATLDIALVLSCARGCVAVSDRVVSGPLPGVRAVTVVGMQLHDRPTAAYAPELSDEQAVVRTRTTVPADTVLYLEVAEMAEQSAAPDAPELAASVQQALRAGFSEVRIESAALVAQRLAAVRGEDEGSADVLAVRRRRFLQTLESLTRRE